MNKDQFAGKWKQLRAQIKVKWGQLTDNELDQIAGNYEMLVGKIQEKYGTSRALVERELDALLGEPARVGSSESAPRSGVSGKEHRPGSMGTEHRAGSTGGTEKPSHKSR
jgi:uncharacterized protein YjbJ (UPF0337 family)